MSVINVILTIMAAIGSANAAPSRLVDLMSEATGYKTHLHTNVTAYDICMYLATGYQYNQRGTHTNITTEAYDDHHQGVARIISRYVNNEYDNTTEAPDTYNKTQRVLNFNVSDCDGVTDDELISWFSPSTLVGTHDQNLERSRREVGQSYCYSPGQNCRSGGGRIDVNLCSGSTSLSRTSICGCAEYGPNAAACQLAYLDGTMWITDRHRNWGEPTALMISLANGRGIILQRPVGFGLSGKEYS